MDRVAGRMSVSADIHSLSMQVLFQSFLRYRQQWAELFQSAFRQIKQIVCICF